MRLYNKCQIKVPYSRTPRIEDLKNPPFLLLIYTLKQIPNPMSHWQNGQQMYKLYLDNLIVPFTLLLFNKLVCQRSEGHQIDQILDSSLFGFDANVLLRHGAERLYQFEPGVPELGDKGKSVVMQFNQKVEVRETYTPQYIFGLAQLQYSREYYCGLQTQILFALKFKLQFTTPYDYIDIFYAKFPWNINFKNALADILDLVLVLPFTASYSTEELFFGTVQTILTEKRVSLSNTQRSVLAGMTDTWGKAQELSVLILGEISQFLA